MGDSSQIAIVPDAIQAQQLKQPVNQSCKRLVAEIERRIANCEQAVGVIPGCSQPPAAEASLVLNVCRLQQQAGSLLQGSLADVEAKYSELRVWLESGSIPAASILMTLQAKREFVLQQEEQLTATAAQLRTLQSLEPFLNPPALSELDDYKRRMQRLERKGDAISMQLAALEQKVLKLAMVYSTTMNMLNTVMEEWHSVIGDTREI